VVGEIRANGRRVQKISELVMAIIQTKEDIVNALKKKSRLWDKGIEVDGMVVREEKEEIPASFLEDIMQLKIVGILKNGTGTPRLSIPGYSYPVGLFAPQLSSLLLTSR
jgi:hypothetical protein